MNILTKEQILILHKHLIADSGGLPGIRDDNLLDSAVNAPYQSYGGVDFYPGVVEKAARLGYGLIKNHPFLDGNKRIGTHAMLVLLEVNQMQIEYEDDDLIAIILAVAAGSASEDDLYLWLQSHMV